MSENDMLQCLIDNTYKITRADVVTGVRGLVTGWVAKRSNRPLYVYLPTDFGSPHWIYFEVHDLLPEHQIISDIADLNPEIDILYMDDWALSGHQMLTEFERLVYDCKLTGIQYQIIVHTMTLRAEEQLGRLLKIYNWIRVGYLYNLRPDTLNTIMDRHGYDTSSPAVKQWFKKINSEMEGCASPIVSDYKIPNEFGSYPSVYGNCLLIDRQFMNYVWSRWQLLQCIRYPNSVA